MPTSEQGADDPGWGGIRGIPDVLLGLVPFVGRKAFERRTDRLVALRQLFLSFCAALGLFLVMLSLLDLSHRGDALSRTTASAVTAVVGMLGLVGSQWARERPWPCTDAKVLSANYRARFFLQIAFAEASALVGFVLVFQSYSLWPYLIGVALAAVGFSFAAPTRRNLGHAQARLDTAGCTLDLVTALRGIDP